MRLIEPTCPLGYTEGDLEIILGERLPEFRAWMVGQGVRFCEGVEWNNDTMTYEETECDPPHGMVVGPDDVLAFLARR